MLSRLLNPPIIIGVLGPDGSGKSTVAQLLQKELSDEGNDVEIVHLGVYTYKDNETTFLRTVKRIHGRLTGVDHEAERIKNKKERSNKQTLTRFGIGKSIIYFLDMSIRYINAINSDNDVLITDRFFCDLLFHNRSIPIRALVRATKTGPICLFRLSADSEIIAARSEHSIEYIEEMQVTLRETNAQPVCVNNPPEEAVSEILSVVRNQGLI